MSEKKQTPAHLPWKRHGTSIYFANVAGGFDVRNCPDPEALAEFIHRACNSHDALVAALSDAEVAIAEAALLCMDRAAGSARLTAKNYYRDCAKRLDSLGAALKAAKGEA